MMITDVIEDELVKYNQIEIADGFWIVTSQKMLELQKSWDEEDEAKDEHFNHDFYLFAEDGDWEGFKTWEQAFSRFLRSSNL